MPVRIGPHLQAWLTARQHGLAPAYPDGLLPVIGRVAATHVPPPDSLRKQGGTRQGLLFTGSTTREDLNHLMDRPDEAPEYVELAVPLFREDAGGRSGGSPARRTFRPAATPDGAENALVAVIDDGVDVFHRAFRDAATSRTRILACWDQTRTPTAGQQTPAQADPARFDLPTVNLAYGTYYSRASIDDLLQRNDAASAPAAGLHGTKVASIAAGSLPEQALLADASRADLVVVASADVFAYSRFMEALEFVRLVADEAGKPVVVNLSWGQHIGPHDGSSELEQAVDRFVLSGGGRLFVKSAGNEIGAKRRDLRDLAPGATDAFLLAVDVAQTWPFHERVELWFPASARVTLELRGPDGVPVWPAPAALSTANPSCVAAGPQDAWLVQGLLTQEGPKQQILLAFDGDLPRRTWSAVVTNAGITDVRIDAWVHVNGDVASLKLQPPTGRRSPTEVTLTVPGTARMAIAVGGHESVSTDTPLAISSCGPTAAGRESPLLSALGDGMVAAVSGTGVTANAFNNRGTSYAAPSVAGRLAVLLSLLAREGTRPRGEDVLSALLGRGGPPCLENPQARWHRALGWGTSPDLARLLEMLAPPPPRPPRT